MRDKRAVKYFSFSYKWDECSIKEANCTNISLVKVGLYFSNVNPQIFKSTA